MSERQEDLIASLRDSLLWALQHITPPFNFESYKKAASHFQDEIKIVEGEELELAGEDTEAHDYQTCGQPYDGCGDGWDGECPSCAAHTHALEQTTVLEAQVAEHRREIENLVIDIERVLKGEPLDTNALSNLHLIQKELTAARAKVRKVRTKKAPPVLGPRTRQALDQFAAAIGGWVPPSPSSAADKKSYSTDRRQLREVYRLYAAGKWKEAKSKAMRMDTILRELIPDHLWDITDL